MANLTITEDDVGFYENGGDEESKEIYKKCFTLQDYYKQCLSFYHKGKDVIKITYQDKMRLTALWKQASVGKYDPSKIPEVGYFDVVGNDRKLAWEGLGDMPKEKAMEEFCSLMERLAPELEAFLEAQYRDAEEKKRKKLEEERRKREEEEEEEERKRKEEEERAERERLIIEEENRKAAEEEERTRQEDLKTDEQKNALIMQHKPQANGTPSIAPASLWSRPKVKEFIQHVRTDPGSVLVVGRGETITVRVPTHENGTCLFWEFATESYDVGFGVSFEWSLPSSEGITVEVDENEDEPMKDNVNEAQKPRVDEILPTVRRPCNEEVMVGSHLYPGRGVYLLKFDNSYSLFRSKTLFYRVYYTR